MSRLHGRSKDYYGGVLMILVGLGVAFIGTHDRVGGIEHMGPGFFPTAVGVMLAVTGLVIAVSGQFNDNISSFSPEWRGWSLIVAGILAFIVLGTYGGLVPATFALVFISALGDRNNTLLQAFLLSLAMVIIGVLVFWWALQLQLPLFRWG